MTKDKDCRISPRKSLNKQQAQRSTITNSEDEEEGNMITRTAILYYIKYPVFDKKLWYKEIVKYGPYIGGGESIEFIPEEAQILDLLGIF